MVSISALPLGLKSAGHDAQVSHPVAPYDRSAGDREAPRGSDEATERRSVGRFPSTMWVVALQPELSSSVGTSHMVPISATSCMGQSGFVEERRDEGLGSRFSIPSLRRRETKPLAHGWSGSDRQHLMSRPTDPTWPVRGCRRDLLDSRWNVTRSPAYPERSGTDGVFHFPS